MKKSELIQKLLKEKFVLDIVEKLPQRDRPHFIKCIKTELIDSWREYMCEEDGWQIFGDLFGNIDVWKNGDIVRSLFHDKNGLYQEPTQFIVQLIDFMEENYGKS